MTDVSTPLTEFSKHLLVTIFAIFAFTSGALLGATSLVVKATFILSLLMTLMSMSCGFQVIMTKVNYYLSNPDDKNEPTKNVLNTMKTKLQWQYYWSVAALLMLIISIGSYFITENYYLVSIKT